MKKPSLRPKGYPIEKKLLIGSEELSKRVYGRRISRTSRLLKMTHTLAGSIHFNVQAEYACAQPVLSKTEGLFFARLACGDLFEQAAIRGFKQPASVL